MERCGQCGALAEAGDRFCGDCGAALTGCPSCGAPLVAGKKFCTSCGQALAAGVPVAGDQPGQHASPLMLASPGALGHAAWTGERTVAERRVCSVLFCDFVGFTTWSEGTDPEVVREVLSQYFTVARTVIGRYGGLVEKFIGDAVMAAWGAPVAAEGDAERAVRAGLDLLAAVAQLGAEAGVPGLAARVGVVTGEVAVTFGAPGEGLLAGDAVNTASRVQGVAQPGQLLVDLATQRLASGGVGFESVGEHRLKGKAEPVALWRATRVLASVGGGQRADGLEAPLVGRDAELRTIRELLHASAGRRVPRLVLVSGPTGVGKSRLGWEFEKYADGLVERLWWHRGRCLSYGDGAAFWALAEIVRQRLGIAEDDPAGTALDKLTAELERLVPDPAERTYVGVRLGRLLGVAAEGDNGNPLTRQELFAGWRLFFERLAADAPVVLVIEDAEHADAGLLDFLDHVVNWVTGLPIYILVLARPELTLTRPSFGAGRNRTTLTLDPLDAASMDKLVDALVPDMPAPARGAITSHAQGIPLFAVETIRSLIDRDIVRPSGGVYRLVGEVGQLTVPDSLHAVLAARLDALDAGVRRLATDAAVLGSTFSAEALVAVSGLDEQAVRSALADLARRDVLSISADPLSPERGSYRFTQHMLRQVAYDTMSRRDRKTRHLAAAGYLRSAFAGEGEEVADVIARHYLDALEAVPGAPDVGEIRSQAVAVLVRAAERAQRTGAPAQAAASYASAADLHVQGLDASGDTGSWSDAGELWEKAGRAALDGGDYPATLSHAGLARDCYTRHGDLRAAAAARSLLGLGLEMVGRAAEARVELTAALEVLRDQPDVRTVRALLWLANAETWSGSGDADQLTRDALALGQRLDVEVGILTSLFDLRALYLRRHGQRPEAVAYLRENVRLATATQDNLALGRALGSLADLELCSDPAAAAAHSRAAAEYLQRAGAGGALAVAIANLGWALLMLGDWDEADAELSKAAQSGGVAMFNYVFMVHGLLHALRGDTVAAQVSMAALDDMRASEDPQDICGVRLPEAFIAVARRKPDEALRCARSVLSFADTLGMTQDVMQWAWPLAARLAYDAGDAVVGEPSVGSTGVGSTGVGGTGVGGTGLAEELLGLLDARQEGELSPLLRAERELARARLAAPDAGSGEAFAAAVRGLRENGTPYHLAHGLLDYAQILAGAGDQQAAAEAVAEANDIARRLRCQPLLDRSATLLPSGTAGAASVRG